MRINLSWRINTPLVLTLAGLSVAWNVPVIAADDYVVIVNKANPTESISSSDLKKMFLGEKSSWGNGTKVSAVTPSPDRPEYAVVIKKATGMSGADYKRYFIQLSFLGKIVPPPRALESTAAVAHFVSTAPGGISCVPAGDAGAAVKTIKVE
jgi:ABC-type phosphate transport system substrate-binding protein